MTRILKVVEGKKKRPAKIVFPRLGMVCRNENGTLVLFLDQPGGECEKASPVRSDAGFWEDEAACAQPVYLPAAHYPELTWEDEPLAVEAEIALTPRT